VPRERSIFEVVYEVLLHHQGDERGPRKNLDVTLPTPPAHKGGARRREFYLCQGDNCSEQKVDKYNIIFKDDLLLEHVRRPVGGGHTSTPLSEKAPVKGSAWDARSVTK